MPARVRAALVLLPGAQRGGQPRGPRRGGAGHPARPRRHVRDHRRRRRLARRDARASPTASPSVTRTSSALVHHPVNLGYGAALRSGFAAARYELVAFTDGDRQFKVADLGRLTARLAAADAPDVVVGFRIKRADPLVRTLYARAYRLANRIFFGLRVTDVDCACKLFRRDGARAASAVESGGAFFSAELLIKLRAAGASVVEVGVPALPADGRLGDRRQAAGRPPRGPRLLAAPAADVGEPRARARRPPAASPDPRPLAAARPSPSGSASSELTKSRKTSSRGSTIPSPVDSSVRALARPRRRARRRRRGRPGRGPRSTAKIRTPVRTARASASDGRASTSTVWPSRSNRIRAWKVSSASSEMTTRSISAPELLERRGEQVVGQRPLGGQALELHRDRARLPRPDPDRQVAVAVGLLEDHHVAAGEHVDPDALDEHLDELVVHGRIIPRRPADRPARPGCA